MTCANFTSFFFELWLLAVSCWLNKNSRRITATGAPQITNYFYYEGPKGLGRQSFYTPSDRAESDIPRCQEQHQEPGRVAYRCGIGYFTERVVIIIPIPRGSSPRSARSKQRTAGFGIAEGVSIGRSGTELVRRCGRYIGSGSCGLIYGLIPPVLRLRIGGISVREGCCMAHATHHPKHQYTPYQNITIFHFLILPFIHFTIVFFDQRRNTHVRRAISAHVRF